MLNDKMLKAKRHILLCTLYAVLCTPLLAQTSQIGIGLRGGGQMYLLSAAPESAGELKGNVGGVGGLDLRYTFYGQLSDRVGLGFVVGAGFGYGATAIQGTHTDEYTNFDYMGNQIDYTVDSKFHQSDKFAQANASLMLALNYNGFTVNLGPRFLIPFAPSSTLTIDEAHICAYYPAYDVPVVDKPITGALETPFSNQQSAISNQQYSLLLGVELGYEWSVTDRTNLGLQLYTDVGVWSPQLPMTNDQLPIIEVSPILDAANPIPEVSVNSITPYIGSMRYLDFGLRAYVAFSVGKTRKYKQYYRTSRDTRKHHNRYLWQ